MQTILTYVRRHIWLAKMSCVVILFMLMPLSGHAATSCNPQGYASIIGTEVVAVSCVPEGMNDNTVLYYKYRDYECINGVVTMTRVGNTVLISPNGIMDPVLRIFYRTFRNKQGSYVFQVASAYRGLIDGKSMNSYPTGGVYTDVFTEMFDQSLQPPDCQGGDFNTTCQLPANSTVSYGTGRLSHDQELFSIKTGQPLSLSVSLFYRSIQFAPSSIGNGWSHTYEMKLQTGSNGAVTFWNEGKRRIYSLYNNAYYPPRGDFSSLVKNADGTYTITEKDGLKRNFDASGTITSMVDRNNNTLTFTYSSGLLTTVTDPGGRSVTFGYDGSNKLSTVTDPKGNIYQLAYTGGNLTSVTNPDTGQWQYTYSSNGLMESKTDPENNTVTYTYDANNRLASTTDSASKVRSYSYPAVVSAGKIPDAYPLLLLPQKQATFTEKDGNGWTYVYDTMTEKIRRRTDPFGNATTYTYDKQGNMLTKTEPGVSSSVTTTYSYDSKGNVLSAMEPLSRTTNYTYNNFSSVLTITGAPGNFTYTYDTKGNLQTATDPAGSLTQYGYDAKGNLTSITDPRNNVTTLGYDSSNNMTTMTLASGATTTFTHDANGKVLTRTDPNGSITTFTYDSRNRLATVTDPLNHVTTYTYDKNGNLKIVTDANGKVTTNTYNYQGQLTSTLDALGKETSFSYGAAGCPSCTGVDQLTALTDAKSQKTTWTYDSVGRLLAETDPLTNATSYTYGPVSMPLSKTDANGATISYTYDNLKRLTQKTYPGGGATYTYDLTNNILTAANNNVSYTYTYDSANRVKTVSDSRGYSLSYDYDAAGNRTRMTLQPGTADERIYDYAYDNRNRLETLSAPTGTFAFGYDLLDRRATLTYPNQITTSYWYDSAGRLTSIIGPSSASFGYAYDNVGNRLTRTGTTNGSYSYDDIYQLLQASGPEGTENFTYDPVGNRLSGPGAKDTAYQYNAANEMIQGRKIAYQYDYNGNQTTRTVPNAPDKSWTQTWDSENRLIKAEKIKGSERRTVTFTYDPFNRRIGKQLTTVIDGVTNSSKWDYVYDNDSIVLEIYTAVSGTITHTWYTQGPIVDEHLALERNGSLYYYHADAIGSIVAITDAASNTVQSYTYDSYGLPKPSTSFRNSYTFTGREWDPQAGLYYYRARYYDPMEGRFISKDPIGFEGGWNLYAYVHNAPTILVDPEGKGAISCIKAMSSCGDKCAAASKKCREKHKDILECSDRGEEIPGGQADAHLLEECYKKSPECKKCVEDLLKCGVYVPRPTR